MGTKKMSFVAKQMMLSLIFGKLIITSFATYGMLQQPHATIVAMVLFGVAIGFLMMAIACTTYLIESW